RCSAGRADLTPSLLLFKAPPPTATSPLSLHDALPISLPQRRATAGRMGEGRGEGRSPPSMQMPPLAARKSVKARGGICIDGGDLDRKSTRLNSSHVSISYAVFCLKKKKNKKNKIEKKK